MAVVMKPRRCTAVISRTITKRHMVSVTRLVAAVLVVLVMQPCGMNMISGACAKKKHHDHHSGAAPGDDSNAGGGVDKLMSSDDFDAIFPDRNDFYSFDAFVEASQMMLSSTSAKQQQQQQNNNNPNTNGTANAGGFCSTGSLDDQKRELAAVLAHATQETGSFHSIDEIEKDVFCDTSSGISCALGQEYFGRGPLQLTWNFNYARAGNDLGMDLLNNPNLVSTNSTIAFATSIWFWMTSYESIPSCHDALLGTVSPTKGDASKGRFPGFGLTINVVNGGIECGHREDKAAQDKIDAYIKITRIFGVDPGNNLDCENMEPY